MVSGGGKNTFGSGEESIGNSTGVNRKVKKQKQKKLYTTSYNYHKANSISYSLSVLIIVHVSKIYEHLDKGGTAKILLTMDGLL